MKVLIIGAGRMGVRHAQGVLSTNVATKVLMIDLRQQALDDAREAMSGLEQRGELSFKLLEDFSPQEESFDVCILATTASSRKELCDIAVNCGVKHLLIEKPLGQSYDQVKDLAESIAMYPFETVVNLNMRMYDTFIRLRDDLARLPQMLGYKMITLNTGTLGIGCNGIHYLDLLFFVLDADKADIVAAEISDRLIPSGRGDEFCDFGGWAVINFYKSDDRIATAMISMAATSSYFGTWDIVGPNGNIKIDEMSGVRTDTFRKHESVLPIYRYAGDYLPPQKIKINSPMLETITASWIKGLADGVNFLPCVSDSLKVHRLMFEWLEASNSHSKTFPVT